MNHTKDMHAFHAPYAKQLTSLQEIQKQLLKGMSNGAIMQSRYKIR